jgi:hypothetical protein
MWNGRGWRNGGTFDLAGRRYDVKSNVWGTQFQMIDEPGMIVATADRVGRKRWTVERAAEHTAPARVMVTIEESCGLRGLPFAGIFIGRGLRNTSAQHRDGPGGCR